MLERRGIDASGASDEDIRNVMALRVDMFENNAHDGADAAQIILDGVRAVDWRILIGEDAHALDTRLRDRPRDAYTEAFMAELPANGHFAGLVQR